MNTENPVR